MSGVSFGRSTCNANGLTKYSDKFFDLEVPQSTVRWKTLEKGKRSGGKDLQRTKPDTTRTLEEDHHTDDRPAALFAPLLWRLCS
jgi:hypothetical protein